MAEQYAVPTTAQESPSRPLSLSESTNASKSKSSHAEENSKYLENQKEELYRNYPNENWESEMVDSNAPLIDTKVLLSDESKVHIKNAHPEVDIEHVREAINDPDAIHVDPNHPTGYHVRKEIFKKEGAPNPIRVSVKVTKGQHKHVASQANYTRKKLKTEQLYQKGNKNDEQK